MIYNSLSTVFSGNKNATHVYQGIKMSPKINYSEPLRLNSFSNPVEQDVGWITKYTTEDFYGGLGARLSTYMIDNSPVISACLDGITSTIAETTWQLYNDNTPHRTMKIFEELLEQIDFPNKVKDIASFVAYGWSAFEIVFDRPRNGLAFPIRELVTVRQEHLQKWIGDKDNNIIGLKLSNRENGIPREKLVLFRDVPNRGVVEGKGCLRSCFSVFKVIEELKQVLVDQHKCHKNNFVRASVPMSILEMLSGKNNSNPKDVEVARKTMQGIKSLADNVATGKGASAVIPSDLHSYIDNTEMRFTSTPKFSLDVQPLNSNEITILDAIKYYEQQLLTGMSSEHKLVGVGESGSKSSGEVHKSTAETIIAGHCKTISTMFASFLHHFAILNGIKKEHVPDLVAADIDKSNINFKINAAQAVIHASEKGFPEIARDLARDANLPEEDIKDEDEMELDAALIQPPVQTPDLNIQTPGQQLKQTK